MSPPFSTSIPLAKWQAALTAWVEASGLQVAWAKQEGNPPERRKPYCRLDLISLSVVGTDEQGQIFKESTQELTRTLQGTRELVVNVQVVANVKADLAESAWSWINELVSTLETDEVAQSFKDAGLSVSSVGSITDIGVLEQSHYIARTSFDLTLLGAFYRENPTTSNWVNRTIGSGDLEGNSTPEIVFDVQGP